MVNPIEWFLTQLSQTRHFLVALSIPGLIYFFWPALFLDVPRFVLTNLFTFFRSFFDKNGAEHTEWARRLRGSSPPLVSVVVAGYNESGTIENCLRSLAENTYPNKEIIIVDDGSTDGMDRVCKRLSQKYKFVYVRHEERSGKSFGVNHGTSLAHGEFVLIGDADTTFDRDAIYQSMLPFSDPAVGAVSANIRVRNPRASILTRMQCLEYNIGIGLGRRFMAFVNLLTTVSGAFGMFRRSILQDVGNNDVGPGEDFDLTVKVRKAGWKIAFTPKAVCMTNVPVTAMQFIRQRIRWDQTTVRFRLRKHRDLYSWSLYDPLTTFALLDTVFFEIVLLVVRIVYYGFLFYARPQLFIPIAFATWIFYIFSDIVQFSIALYFSDRKREDFWLIGWLPLFSLFSFLYSFVRLYSYIDEWLFYSSMRDRYVPDRVQDQIAV